MTTNLSVSLSGPALSFLLYENTKATFQQEGFLLGEIIHQATKTITDSDQHQVNIIQTIKINSCMPCPEPHYFYNGIGKIDEDKIREFLGSQFSKVVAWYKYQNSSSFKFLNRDKIVHKQLYSLFDVAPELFTCCLLIKEISDNGSTHVYSQAFMRCNNNVCDRLPIHIPNLGDPNNTYLSSQQSASTFNRIVADLKIDTKSTQGLVAINKIQNAVQKHVDSKVEELAKAEAYLFEVEEDIRRLQMSKKAKDRGDDSSDEPGCSRKSDEESCLTLDSTKSDEDSQIIEISSEDPEPERVKNPIDSSSQESSPEVKNKMGKGKGKKKGATTPKTPK